MDADRLNRLETRVDQIRDDVAELKADARLKTQLMDDLKQEFKDHTVAIKEHVLGDNKVINKIEPFLDSFHDLHSMVAEYKEQQAVKKQRNERISFWGVRLGVLATIVSIIVGIAEFFKLF